MATSVVHVKLVAGIAACAGFLLLGVSQAAAAPTMYDVGAYGSIFVPQDLSFRPRKVTAHVGDTVQWTNRDSVVPHTATEDHGLWDLAGTYGGTPFNPSGIAPGTSVHRTFEAGIHHYYCRVHPVQMHGEIDVPVDLYVTKVVKHKKHHKKKVVYTIHVRWATASPASGFVFDVQRARGKHSFSLWMNSTSTADATFTTKKRGSKWHLRARLHRVSDPAAATGWSPDAVITAS